jgi:hypothetical protein
VISSSRYLYICFAYRNPHFALFSAHNLLYMIVTVWETLML